jgi:hypothetical protein
VKSRESKETENRSIREREEWYTCVELQLALKKGYRITKIHRIVHWEKTSIELFGGYIRTFLKIKAEASGWPNGDKTTEEEKKKYLDEFEQYHGFALDPNKICNNKGLREVAKLCLNSLWGKFCQREDLPTTKTFNEGNIKEYFQYINNTELDKKFINPISLEEGKLLIEVTFTPEAIDYTDTTKRITSQTYTNIAIGVFTTAHARAHLYEHMDMLGNQVLYCDTDSIIYVLDPTNKEHKEMPTSDNLGQMKNELVDSKGRNHIVAFRSGGPKNYAYKLARKDAKGKDEYVKVKGFPLNRYSLSKAINFTTISDVVQDFHEEETKDEESQEEEVCYETAWSAEQRSEILALADYEEVKKKNERGQYSHQKRPRKDKEDLVQEFETIQRDKRRRILKSAKIKRTYAVVFDKRELQEDFTSLPFGHQYCKFQCPHHNASLI